MSAISALLAQWREAEARVAELQGDLLDGRLKTAAELREIEAARACASALLSELLSTATDVPTVHRPSYRWHDCHR
jgi:hypothetical protein